MEGETAGGPTVLQRCLADAVLAEEPAAAGDDVTTFRRIVAERGVGVTEALMRTCLFGAAPAPSRESAVGSLMVVPHVAATQAASSLRRLAPGDGRWALVGSKRDLDRFAALLRERVSAGGPWGGLCVVTDSFYSRLIERAGDIIGAGEGLIFKRAVFDDSWALRLPACPDPRAAVSWAVVGDQPVFGGGRGRGFLARRLSEPAPAVPRRTVWCDDRRVCRSSARPGDMFGASGDEEHVRRSVTAWGPSTTTETARSVLDWIGIDANSAAGLIGRIKATHPSWRGWRAGDDRSCPICLCGPDEALETKAAEGAPVEAPVEGPAEVLRVRARCCGREFYAECLARTIVSLAERGLPPSCPQCRDNLGGCPETCEPIVVRRGPDPADSGCPGFETVFPEHAGSLKTREEMVAESLRLALDESEDTRVLVVAPTRSSASLVGSAWFRQAAVQGAERLCGCPAAAKAVLERFRDGLRRVMVVEGGPRSEVGVRMPWVTHVLVLDCLARSRHWVRRTQATPIDRCLARRLGLGASPRSGAVSKRKVAVKRMMPVGLLFNRRGGGLPDSRWGEWERL